MEKITFGLISLLLVIKGLFMSYDSSLIPDSIFSFIESQQLKLEEWKIYKKEELGEVTDSKEFQQVVDNIGSQANIENWKYETVKDHHYKAIGYLKTPPNEPDLTVMVFGIYNSGNLDVSVTQTINGQDKNSYNKVKLIDFSHTDQPQLFYTLTASTSQKYENKQILSLVNEFMKKFSAKESEKVIERDFISVSSYSKEINNDVSLGEGKKMNLQIAMRSLQDKTTLTIGSPIIITEY